ncbi:MAG: pentapeptide repeat-containing protein [Paracoccaceae bacterium]
MTARSTWFALLGYLAFVVITLLGVEDADFFIDTRQTQLPLVGVSIPTASFFIFAPTIGAALYIYFHLHLRKLWEALYEPPPIHADCPLDEQIYPWLVNDLVLRIRNDGAASKRPLDFLAGLVTGFLVWAAGPFVLMLFWWRSMPAHAEGMTLLIAFTLILSMYAGLTSWWFLGTCSLPRDQRVPIWSGLWKRSLGVPVTTFIVCVSWLRTEAGFEQYAMMAVDFYEDVVNEGEPLPRFTGRTYPDGGEMFARTAQEIDVRKWVWTVDDLTLDPNKPNPLLTATIRLLAAFDGRFSIRPFDTTLAVADLRGIENTLGEAEITGREISQRKFRAEWCRRKGLEPNVCGNLYTEAQPAPPHIRPNRNKWCVANNFQNLEPGKPDSDSLDSEPTRPGLTPATELACFSHFSRLDAEFRSEWREERIASATRSALKDLRGRDLRDANMEFSNLSFAQLQGARLENASLYRARLQRADLSWARLDWAKLNEAQLEGAVFWQAQMQGVDLRLAFLEGANFGSAFLNEARFNVARLEEADLGGARLKKAGFFSAYLSRANLSYAKMDGASFNGAQLDGANFKKAQMDGADLSDANLNGTILIEAVATNINWEDAHLSLAAHAADLRGAKGLTQWQLRNVIGDSKTLVPPHLRVWSCWISPPDNIDQIAKAAAKFNPQTDEQIKSDWICPPGIMPQPTGTQLELDERSPFED